MTIMALGAAAVVTACAPDPGGGPPAGGRPGAGALPAQDTSVFQRIYYTRVATAMKSDPTRSAATLALLPPGTAVKAIYRQGGWLRADTATINLGWVALADLQTSPPPRAGAARLAPTPGRRAAGTPRRTGEAAVVRRSPSARGAWIGTVAEGTLVSVVRRRDGWAAIELGDGRLGWIAARAIGEPAAPARDAVPRTPRRTEPKRAPKRAPRVVEPKVTPAPAASPPEADIVVDVLETNPGAAVPGDGAAAVPGE